MKLTLIVIFAIISLLFTTSIAEGFLKGTVGLKETDDDVSHLVCADKLCLEVDELPKNKDSPLGQFKIGISLPNILCKDGFELVLKKSNQRPACVSPETKTQLVLRGWATNDIIENQILSEKQTESTIDDKKDFGMSIIHDEIDGKRFLIFEGFGWHRLHQVVIDITNDQGFSTTLKTKTTDRGYLLMPWPVDDLAIPGMYHIVASDGIHNFEINIPITSPLNSDI